MEPGEVDVVQGKQMWSRGSKYGPGSHQLLVHQLPLGFTTHKPRQRRESVGEHGSESTHSQEQVIT